MNDLPLAALIISIAAAVICGVGGLWRMGCMFFANAAHDRRDKERTQYVQNLCATAAPVVVELMRQSGPRPREPRCRIRPDEVMGEPGEEEEPGKVPYRPEPAAS